MIESPQSEQARHRILRSARVLKAFFEHKLNISLELLTAPPPEPLIDGVEFDLTIRNWGIWGLRSSTPLSQPTQVEIAGMFHGLLGAMDQLEDKRHDLLRLQSKFERSLEDSPSNILPFRRPRLPGFSEAVHDLNRKRWTIRLDCLIESRDVMDIHKMALELHSQSRRYAFVDHRDLSEDVRQDSQQLFELGEISLFIPNILTLSLREQEVLRALIQGPVNQRPLLMVGAHRPYSDLRTDSAIDLKFLILLARAYIKLTRPFAEYKDKGLIHYFLDSLAQSPS